MKLTPPPGLLLFLRNGGLGWAKTKPGVNILVTRRWKSAVESRIYDDAIELLNTLQTPYHILKQRREAGIKIDATDKDRMRECLTKIGISQSDLTRLNIIHIAGTKGKGSTCAYISSMLTHYTTRKLPPREIDHEVDNTGFLLSHRWPEIPNIKVGLFTSPHLLSVRERIRINNTPVSAALFTHYFFTVWDLLSSMEQKPGYFRFLTLLSFHVFLSEGVNAAIYECGIGGEYDGTNIIERPAVTGITSLGIDHVFTLGSTIEEIAWHKAGIMKRNVPAFTVEQEEGAMEVIKKRAKERQVSKLKIVKLDERLEVGVKIVPDADFQRGNASLALAVTETVLKQLQAKRHSNRPDLQWNDYIISQDGISQELKDGINNVVFRGRFEKIKKENITWYLDGAHTAESIKVATQWFKHEMFYAKDPADFINQMRKSTRVLLFNQQGDREAVDLLERLYRASQEGSGLDFDQVVFCPTKRKSSEASKKDFVNNAHDGIAISELTLQKQFAEKWRKLAGTKPTIKVCPTIDEAFAHIKGLPESVSGEEVQVFITGSIHLVGTALSIIENVDAL